jgi:hypothetical protein
VNALAEAVTAQYEQPNLPIPANPSLEFDVGYANTNDNYGPTGSATASTLYPGQVIANIGPELSLLVPGVPLPAAPIWPLQAVSNYPQTPSTASTDEPGVNMDAVSTTDGNTATAALGDDASTAGANGATSAGTAPSGTGNPLAATSDLIGIGGISATSSSTAPSTAATATASATVSGISILDGFINIGAVTSTATANSDGTTGTVSGSTLLGNVSIAGEAVTITANGISVTGKNSALALPIAALNTLLKEVGISLTVNSAVDKVSGASASRTLNGLELSINLDTLDSAVNKLSALVPAKILSELPVALPNSQVLTVDIGSVSVSSDASPSFSDDSGAGSAGDDSGDTGTTSFGGTTTGDSFGGGSLDVGSTGTTGTGSVGTTTPSGGGSGGSPTGVIPTSAVTPAFTGVGAGLILLGLVAALLLAYLYKRMDDVSELVGSGCADGDPLAELFSDGPDQATGGFGA